MQFKYRGITYNPSSLNDIEMPTEKTGVYRGVHFRSQSTPAQSQPLGVRLSYRGNEYLK